MRILSFVLLALVGTMILGLPLQSYADPQLDTLLNIATQARDNLGATISQTNNVSNEINQLYKQGSTETDQLATAVSQQDVAAAKQHFLAAMKFFKETNDKINSLNATASNDQQKVKIAQLRGEIIRLDNMENLLKNIAATNNIQVDFTKFDELIQTAQQDLDSGNVNDAITSIKNANDFLVETHNSLTTIAKERASERAKDFTQRQIERFSKMNGFNTTSPAITPQTIPPPITTPTISKNTTGTNTTSPAIIQQSTIQNNVNSAVGQNPEEMLAELKKLVSEGKVNEALKVIKMIEAYQNGKLKMSEKIGQLQSSATTPNVTVNSSSSTATTLPPPTSLPPTPNVSPTFENTTGTNTQHSTITPQTIPPPITTPPISKNTTGTNTTSPAITPQTIPPPITTPPISKNTTGTNTPHSTIPSPPPTHGGNEKHDLEKNKHVIRPHQSNNRQNSNGQD